DITFSLRRRRDRFEEEHGERIGFLTRTASGETSPSAGILDSQSVKASAASERGYDAGKKIVGRKRHIAVDTDGRLLMVNLTTADISDSAGARVTLEGIPTRA